MNSSGIKRGLAASAISALAIAGLPLLASSANAAPGDSMAVGSVGPTLNGGGVGGVVVLKTKGITVGDVANLTVFNSNLQPISVGDADGPTQNVDLLAGSTFVADGDPGDSNPTDGFDEITAHVTVTTPVDGGTANYALVVDDNADGIVQASEARTQVSQATSGALADIDVSPASQSTPQNIQSGAYTVTLKDAAGRTTQLNTGENVGITTDGDIALSDATLDATELELGSATFKATPDVAAPTGTRDIDLTSTTSPVVTKTAKLVITQSATITNDEVDVVTGADNWDGFGGGNFGAPSTLVRVDQTSVRIDIDSNDPNSTVQLTVTSADMTFGGKTSTTVSTVLDSDGKGSLTITPDAGTIQDGDSFATTGAFGETFVFERAAADAVEAESGVYYSKLKESTDVTATVVDQFGNPVTGGVVEAYRSAGPNAEAASEAQRKAVGPNGEVTFTFTDAKAVLGDEDTIQFVYFEDQFDNSGTNFGTTKIKYTADGQGANYTTSLDTLNTESPTYDATKVQVKPLSDAHADDDGTSNESAEIDITGGEALQAVTISVDNGALILTPTSGDSLSKGTDSVVAQLDGLGALPAGYRVIGTKAGVVTVTITSANRTETAQFTVSAQTEKSEARNVTVSGPAEVESGTTQIAYTAVITDAFGNPVANVPVTDLNIQVTGPAQFQDSGAITDANGAINLNVRVDAGAEGDVSIKVQGFGEQFGAAADQETASLPANGAKGLDASSNIATATTTVKGAVTPPPPPADRTPITAHLSGHNNGARPDRLKVNGPNIAAGAQVKLFKFVNGKKKLVDFSHLNKYGNHKFVVADRNGRAKTKYIARVVKTLTTWGDTTNRKRVR